MVNLGPFSAVHCVTRMLDITVRFNSNHDNPPSLPNRLAVNHRISVVKGNTEPERNVLVEVEAPSVMDNLDTRRRDERMAKTARGGNIFRKLLNKAKVRGKMKKYRSFYLCCGVHTGVRKDLRYSVRAERLSRKSEE